MAVGGIPDAAVLGLVLFLHYVGAPGIRAEGAGFLGKQEFGIVIVPHNGVPLLLEFHAYADIHRVVPIGYVQAFHDMLEERKAPAARGQHQIPVFDFPGIRSQHPTGRVHLLGRFPQDDRDSPAREFGRQVLYQQEPPVRPRWAWRTSRSFTPSLEARLA